MEHARRIAIALQLHPVVDHFTIALLIAAVLADLVASALHQRLWLRYMAATLMVTGAVCAGLSYLTGGMEAQRLGHLISGPAKEVFARHTQLGFILMIVFAVLAVWRILLLFNFMAPTRQIFLAFAVLAAAALIYQGALGGQLVYTFQVGTGPEAGNPLATAVPQEAPTATPAPGALPTVYVPTPAALASPSTIPSPSASVQASESPSAEPSPEASSATEASPEGSPAASASPGDKMP